MAAEIVAAQANETKSRLVRRATWHVETDRFQPQHVSELASALGTLEFQSGSRSRVRKFFSKALVSPTENSVAQAAWIQRHMPGFTLEEELLDAPRAFEARAWEAVAGGRYEEAVDNASGWLADEPFATRPALFGSWIASTALGDHEAAIRFLDGALIANPEDPRLLADLLYNRASANQVDEAEALLSVLERTLEADQAGHSAEEWRVLLAADRGLIAFRRGMPEAGREHYASALDVATRHGLREFGASALINLSREEARIGEATRVDSDSVKKAIDAFPAESRGAVAGFVARVLGALS
jgi:hypothetical protein